MKKTILYLFYVSFSLGLFISGILGGYMIGGLYFVDSSELSPENIKSILSKESILYYNDGTTQLGSLFGETHRIYTPLAQIPEHTLHAIVAAEDGNFYHHFGIDLVATVKAAVLNVFSSFQGGASTLTQQTVKNLFGRPKVNLWVKLNEAIYALRLEKQYSKKEILEFYLNQFHVVSNGHGLAIAARYYFDKETYELTPLESAFIAGSVKAPYKYNAFVRRDKASKEKALKEAIYRKNYVIRRMKDLNFITEKEWEGMNDKPVPFKQGRFQFNELAILESIKEQLKQPEILKGIGVENIEDIANAGLRITTTLDAKLQEESQYAVRKNLSRLEMMLSGFKKENKNKYMNVSNPLLKEFYVAKISRIEEQQKKKTLYANIGVHECAIHEESLKDTSNLVYFSSAIKQSERFPKFLSGLQKEDFVLVSLEGLLEENLSSDKKDHSQVHRLYACHLEVRPRIEGGALVMQEGRIRAMIPGFGTYGYNRAMTAQRQPGSTFKILTYYAALQMGWNVLDMIPNIPGVHPWQGQFYFPRADHTPQTLMTHIVASGAKSENLSSVWLLRHLLDKLTPTQFQSLLESLNLKDTSLDLSSQAQKLRSRFNIVFSEETFKEGVFEASKQNFLNDISIVSNQQLLVLLRMMEYGRGFEKYDEILAKKGSLKENIYKRNLLKNHFLRWKTLAKEAQKAFQEGSFDSRAWGVTSSGELAYLSSSPYLPGNFSSLMKNPEVSYSQEEVLALKENVQEGDILLEGLFPLYLIGELEAEMEGRQEKALEETDFWEQLYYHADFRYSLAMYYTQQMVQQMGMDSKIEWVPSFPLGSNVVTLAELSKAYQTILKGETYQFFETGVEKRNEHLLIERIEDSFGHLLWEASSKKHALIDEDYAIPMLSTLRAVVTHGTGSRASEGVFFQGEQGPLHVPSFGKTGTTNNYVNATFVGFVPSLKGFTGKSFENEEMYTISSYVGYDTNEPMRASWFKVTGSSGPLPAWIDIANSIFESQKYRDEIKDSSLKTIPFDYGKVPEVALSVNGLSQEGIPVYPIHSPFTMKDDLPIPERLVHYFKPLKEMIEIQSVQEQKGTIEDLLLEEESKLDELKNEGANQDDFVDETYEDVLKTLEIKEENIP